MVEDLEGGIRVSCSLCGAQGVFRSNDVAKLEQWVIQWYAPLADRGADLCPECHRSFRDAVRRQDNVRVRDNVKRSLQAKAAGEPRDLAIKKLCSGYWKTQPA